MTKVQEILDAIGIKTLVTLGAPTATHVPPLVEISLANRRALVYVMGRPSPKTLCVVVTRSSSNECLMKKTDHLHEAEIAIGARSRHQAEAETKNVGANRLATGITEFIEWRAFSYWLRLIVETQGFVSEPLIAVLQERCPAFLEYATAYARQHPREPEFLWLRFLEWTDERLFHLAIAEGWRHALGYYATRDPRMDQIRKHWKQCRQAWKLQPPAPFPDFESWREAAFQRH